MFTFLSCHTIHVAETMLSMC